MAFSMAASDEGIEGLHGDHLRLGRVNLGDLVERHLRAVVVHRDRVQHVDGGAAGAGRGHFLAEIFHRLVHAGLQLDVQFFQGGMLPW